MSATVYMTTCGVPVNSVDMEFFDTLGEWIDYVEEMNEIECGTRGSGAIQQKIYRKRSTLCCRTELTLMYKKRAFAFKCRSSLLSSD